jgi:hypothetical protein
MLRGTIDSMRDDGALGVLRSGFSPRRYRERPVGRRMVVRRRGSGGDLGRPQAIVIAPVKLVFSFGADRRMNPV